MSYLNSIDEHEKLNVFSHGLGSILAILAMIILLKENSYKSFYAASGLVIYSITLISMLTVSTLYHCVTKTIFHR